MESANILNIDRDKILNYFVSICTFFLRLSIKSFEFMKEFFAFIYRIKEQAKTIDSLKLQNSEVDKLKETILALEEKVTANVKEQIKVNDVIKIQNAEVDELKKNILDLQQESSNFEILKKQMFEYQCKLVLLEKGRRFSRQN